MGDNIDILSRENFLKQLLNLVNTCSANKESVAFSINGKWGVGKTWVLNAFEEQLGQVQNESTATNRYLIFHYNAWEYDYYDEPVISMISAMVESVDEKNHILSSKSRVRIISSLKKIGSKIFSTICNSISSKTGIDFNIIADAFSSDKKERCICVKENTGYDRLYALRIELKKLKSQLCKLAETYTLVFIVDELDRCIPEYAIKVLERLHHITNDIDNMITIVATDKSMLEQNIQKVFGFSEAKKYLEKFIQFELTLDKGKISESVVDKYKHVIDRYEQGDFPKNHTLREFWQIMALGLDERKHEHIIRKLTIVNNLLFGNIKKDHLFFCLELYYSIMIDVYGQGNNLSEFFSIYEDKGNIFPPNLKERLPGGIVDFFDKELTGLSIKLSKPIFYTRNYVYYILNNKSLQMTLLFFVQAVSIAKSNGKTWEIITSDGFYNKSYVATAIDDLIKFIDLYKIFVLQ